MRRGWTKALLSFLVMVCMLTQTGFSALNGIGYVYAAEADGDAVISTESQSVETTKEEVKQGEVNSTSEDPQNNSEKGKEEIEESNSEDQITSQTNEEETNEEETNEEEKTEAKEPVEETVSENVLPEEIESENTVIENTVTENTVIENTVSENTVSENTVSENTVSENTVSANTISENKIAEKKIYTYEDDRVIITVTYEDAGAMDDNAVLTAHAITQEASDYAITGEKLKEKIKKEKGGFLLGYDIYDVTFELNGEEVEPDGEAKVRIEYKKPIFTEFTAEDSEVAVFHMEEDAKSSQNEIQEVTDSVNQKNDGSVDEVKCTVDSFSFIASVQLADGDWSNSRLSYHLVDEKDDTFTNTKYYNPNCQLGVAGNFHVVAFNKATLLGHTNGNILADKLDAGVNFGTNNYQDELSYIRSEYNKVNGGSASKDNHVLALGSNIQVGLCDNNNAFEIENENSAVKIDRPLNIYQDENTNTLPFINFEETKKEIKEISDIMSNYQEAGVTFNNTSGSDKATIILQDPDGLGVWNVDAETLNNYSGKQLVMTGFQTGHSGTVLVNVDCTGVSSIKMPKAGIVEIDGEKVSHGEAITFENGKVIWNFLNAEGKTIHTSADHMIGCVIALGADVEEGNNLCGSIIAENVTIHGESHRTDFTGRIYPTTGAFKITKSFGGTWPADGFQFKLTGKDNAPMPNDADPASNSKIITATQDNRMPGFGTITYSYDSNNEQRVYYYTIEEVKKENDLSINYDPTIYQIRATVTSQGADASGNKRMIASWEYQGKDETWHTFDMSTFAFSFTNTQKVAGAVLLTKQNDSGDPLKGAEFELQNKNNDKIYAVLMDGNYVAVEAGTENATNTFVTNEKGQIFITGLAVGEYVFTETKAPEKYEMIGEGKTNVTITSEAANITDINTVKVVVVNSKFQASLELQKIDADNGISKGLNGAKFDLFYKADGEKEYVNLGEIISETRNGIDGVIYKDGLTKGEYYLVETKAPEGYTLDTNTRYMFSIMTNGEKVTKVNVVTDQSSVDDNIITKIPNTRVKGKVEIEKVNTTGTALEGAVFILYAKNATAIKDKIASVFQDGYYKYGEYTTDKDGKITVSDLPWGDYFFIETKAPKGYEIVKNQDGSNIKYDFSINDTNASDENTITTSITVTNKEQLGSAKLVKVDEETKDETYPTLLKDAQFKLYKADDSSYSNETYTTDENGEIHVSNLPWGTYYFQETQAPEGYTIQTDGNGNAKKYSFTINEKHVNDNNVMMTQIVKVTNAKIYGYVKLQKTLSTGITPPESLSLEGIKFGLYHAENDKLISYYVTNAEGKLTKSQIGKLAYGSYYFKETAVPEGFPYKLDSNKRVEFTIQNASITPMEYCFENSSTQEVHAGASFKKVDSGMAPIKDAIFELYKDNTKIGEVCSDEKGIVAKDGLTVGTYYFVETSNPGYTVDRTAQATKYYFAITSNDNGKMLNVHKDVLTGEEVTTVTNEEKTGSIKLLKKDQKGNALDGAVFTLYRESGNQTADVVVETNITTKNGIYQKDGLTWGKYYFKEIKAPSGYIDDPNKEYPQNHITIDRNSVENPDGTTHVAEVTITNTFVLGKVTLSKMDQTSKERLKGVEFALWNQGTNTQVKNETTQDGTYVTDADGKLTVDNLPVGNYYFVETAALPGYQISDTKYPFTIDGTDTDVTVNEGASIANERILGKASLYKVDAENTGKVLAGAEFTLYKEEKLFNFIPYTSQKSVYTTDAHGYLEVSGLEWGSYKLVETKAPIGYELSKDEASRTKTFVIDATHLDYTGTASLGTITNTLQKGSIKLVKKDAETGENLANAEFELYRKATDTEKTDSFITKLTTDENGEAAYGTKDGEVLVWGDYYLIETKAPAGYEESVNEDGSKVQYPFSIDSTHSGDVMVQKEISNTRKTGSIQIEKVDGATKAPLQGAEFTIYRKNAEGESPTQVGTMKTDENGKAAYGKTAEEELSWGAYYLVETKAPVGYRIITGPNGEEIHYSFTIGALLDENGKTIELFNQSFTGDHAIRNAALTSISGKKEWIIPCDGEDNPIEGYKYPDITIQLVRKTAENAEFAEVAGKMVVLQNGAQDFTFDQLDKYDEQGNEYEYSVVEKEYDQTKYESTVTKHELELIVTNKAIEDPMFIKGDKKWIDPIGTKHPDIQIQLVRDNVPMEDKLITLHDGETEFSFDDLYKYDLDDTEDGHEYTYAIRELDADGNVLIEKQLIKKDGFLGYTSEIKKDETLENVYHVVNTVSQEKVEISGNKIWKDTMDPEKRPDVELSLYADHHTTEEPIATYVIKAPATIYTFKDLDKYDLVTGKEIVYTVKEKAISGYVSSQDGNDFMNTSTKVYFSKVDHETGTELTGAKLIVTAAQDIYDKDGTIVNRLGDVLESWTSNGQVHVMEASLEAGANYLLTEIMAPEGYELAASIPFTVKADGSVLMISMKDAKTTTSKKEDTEEHDHETSTPGTPTPGVLGATRPINDIETPKGLIPLPDVLGVNRSPQTGDDNQMGLWMMLFAASAITMVGILLPKRKSVSMRNKNKVKIKK